MGFCVLVSAFCLLTPSGAQALPAGEFLIDTSGAQSEMGPTVASDGTNYLVVWYDNRNGPGFDIYGARVSQAGSVLDPSGLAISTAPGNQYNPDVSFDGTDFLVVWHDLRSGSGYDIYGARVSQSGSILDPDGIAISTASSDQGFPAACFGGTDFLVVWMDGRNGLYDIYGARVNQAGSVLDSDGISISTAPAYQRFPVVSFGGTDFLVAWEEGTPPPRGSPLIRGARVSQAGTVLDTSGIAIGTRVSMQMNPAVTFGGANFLVVWDDESPSGLYIYGTFVNPGGGVLSPFGITTASGTVSTPEASFDGTSYPVVWVNHGPYDIYGARVRADGTVYAEGPVVTEDGPQRVPMLACDSSGQTFLVYQGWAGTVGGKTYDTLRVWGKMDPLPGVEDSRWPTAYDSRPTATVVRGLLDLSVSPFAIRTLLFDMNGRQVIALHPGANDVSGLAPGVYFVRQEPQATGPKPQAVRKVIITR